MRRKLKKYFHSLYRKEKNTFIILGHEASGITNEAIYTCFTHKTVYGGHPTEIWLYLPATIIKRKQIEIKRLLHIHGQHTRPVTMSVDV